MVMGQGVVNIQELKRFFDYLQDKVDPVYERETKQAIERFLKEDVDRMHGANIIRG
jgi:hypothetical protein